MMPRLLTLPLALLAALAIAAPARADVHRIREPDGTVRYTNRPGAPRSEARKIMDPDGAIRLVLRGGVRCVPRADRGQYDAWFHRAAKDTGVNVDLLKAVARVESGFDPRAVSQAGAKGLMQLMPATARHLGVTDVFDPAESIEAGASYLAGLLNRFHGDLVRALAAYNAGPDAVVRHDGLPPFAETRAYVRRVFEIYWDALTAGRRGG